jgi:hypothetical protein
MRGFVLVGLALTLAGCGQASNFACSEDDQCENSGIGGFCEPNGYCSFGDDDCPSGRRYGDLAGDGLASVCVEVGGSTGATTGPNPSSGSSGSTTAGDTNPIATDTAEDTTSGPLECPPSAVCVAPPAGWSGPVALSAGDCLVGNPVFTGGVGVEPESPCNCQCSEFAGACDYGLWSTFECVGDVVMGWSASTECEEGDFTTGFAYVSPGVSGASCLSDPPTPAVVEESLAVCELGPPLGACEDGSPCFDPSETSICTWSEGEQECPEPGQERTILYRSAAGSFDCGCQCSPVSAPDCNITFYADDACGEIVAEVSFGLAGCAEIDLPPTASHARIRGGECQEGGSRNTPEPNPKDPPTEVDPITVCCQ